MGISGRYEAQGRDPRHTREVLHLRVDADRVEGGGPVTNWISGDIFERNALDPNRGKHVFSWRIKVPPREGAEKDSPRPVPFTFGGEATRLVSGSAGSPLPVTIDIGERRGQADLPCTVTVTMSDGVHTFDGSRIGPEFRTLELGVAFCTAAFRHPDCELRPQEPALEIRRLRLNEAFAAAGVALKQQPAVQIEDTSNADGKAGWSTPELHASLQAQLISRELDKDSDWPRWFLWGLLADKHASGDLGVMFDEREPNRQGFAVFQTHSHGPTLPPLGGALGAEHAEALRLYFFTWVHEMGHGFSLMHSNQKSRPRALSWMNDDDALDKNSDFWNKFKFSFDDEEIVHIRHGDWEEVVMGGLPLGRGGHLRESSSVLDFSPAILDESKSRQPLPLEVWIDHGGYFDLMQPISISVKVTNGSDKDLEISADLGPESGSLAVLIRQPDGGTVEYVPPVRRFRQNDTMTLRPRQFHKQLLHLTYGRDGFSFENPGQYVLRVVYLGAGDNFIVSNPLRVRVGIPATAALDRLAQDFFAPDIGRCLYFGGSPYLGEALKFLAGLAMGEMTPSAATDGRRSWLGADIARVIADGIARPFRYVAKDGTIQTINGRPDFAVTLTESALAVYRSVLDTPSSNPRYEQLLKTHDAWMNVAADAVGQMGETAVDVVRSISEDALDLVKAFRLRYPGLPW